jgi:D-threonate/D-erythronate kinase
MIAVWNEKRMMSITISDKKIEFEGSSEILKQRLDEAVSHLIAQCEIDELLVEGGATTYSILKYLDWNILTPISELAPGVVRMKVSKSDRLYLTIKPGSYSWPPELINIQ